MTREQFKSLSIGDTVLTPLGLAAITNVYSKPEASGSEILPNIFTSYIVVEGLGELAEGTHELLESGVGVI